MKSLRMTYQHSPAPEIYGDHWFNSDPLSIRELHGRPVVLFFCDRSSLQSQGLIPLFNGMYALYLEYGLTCIAIHSPEFLFGKDLHGIEQWIKKNLITFPVVTDNEHSIINAFRISSTPAFCLIDNKGDIYDTITDHFIPERIERSVQYLLRQSGYRGELPILINPAFDRGYLLTGDVIQDIYTGYSHGALGNPEGYSPELSSDYVDPQIHVNGKFYLHGSWRAERDSISFEGEPNSGYLLCESDGEEMCVLVGAKTKTTVKIFKDKKPLSINTMGNDVRKDKKGDSVITIEDPKLFSVLKISDAKRHTIRFVPQKRDVRFYLISSITHALINDGNENKSIRNN